MKTKTCCPVCGGKLIPWSSDYAFDPMAQNNWRTMSSWVPWVDVATDRRSGGVRYHTRNIDICEDCETVVS